MKRKKREWSALISAFQYFSIAAFFERDGPPWRGAMAGSGPGMTAGGVPRRAEGEEPSDQ
jgi:hypothetical protein